MFCLDDLAAQKIDARFEVILILQEYPAGFADSIRTRFSNSLVLQIAEYPTRLGVSRARNAGLELAHADIVAFVDDDVRLPSHWAASMLRLYSDASVGAVGGYVDHPGQYTLARRAAYRVLGITSNRYVIDWGGFNRGPSSHRADEQPADWLTGCNMSFRRSVLNAIGGFDEDLGSFWHEDADATHAVLKAGWRVISSGKMAVKHYPSPINRAPLHLQMRARERRRVLFVRKAIGDRPLWPVRYAARLILQAAAMAVVGVAKLDLRIPFNVIRGGWEGYRELDRPTTANEPAAR